MINYIFIVLSFLLFPAPLYTSENHSDNLSPQPELTIRECATDVVAEELLREHPELREKRERIEKRIREKSQTTQSEKSVDSASATASQSSSAQTSSEDIRTVPVVFHVIHGDGPENATDDEIKAALDYLNSVYRNETGETVDMKLQFALAKLDPEGNCTDGINRIYDPEATSYFTTDHKQISYWDNTSYMNVWLVGRTYGRGYATFPEDVSPGSYQDGVVIMHDYLNTTTFPHEVGHYLGLYHTFSNNCTDQNGQVVTIDESNCESVNDLVCDTPPESSEDGGTPDQTNTCTNDSPDLDDDIHNIMSEANTTRDHFTEGQSTRVDAIVMDEEIASVRAALWSVENLEETGVVPESNCVIEPVADFYAVTPSIQNGFQVELKDLSYRQENETISQWEWNLSGGTPSSSTEQNPFVSYEKTSYYDVGLSVNDHDKKTKTAYISVFDTEPEPLKIFGGSNAFAAIGENGKGFAWGDNYYYKLGIEKMYGGHVNYPWQIQLGNIDKAAFAYANGVFLNKDGLVYVSGDNSYGQLGFNSTSSSSFYGLYPIDGLAGVHVIDIAIGDQSLFALDDTGKVWAWGKNDQYQLGNGGTTSRSVPQVISGLPTITKIKASNIGSLALDTDGYLWGWGYAGGSNWLQLSSGDTHAETPTRIETINSVADMEINGPDDTFVIAKKQNKSLWCWGYNGYAQCGLGHTNTYVSSPTQIKIYSFDAKILATGTNSTYVLASYGDLWAWGNNSQWQLAKETGSYVIKSPTLILDQINTIAANNESLMTMTTDNLVCVNGTNSSGQFGSGNTILKDYNLNCVVGGVLWGKNYGELDQADQDKDGFTPSEGDCDDADATSYPGAEDNPADGIDNNCDDKDEVDNDGDGQTEAGGDCDDANATTYCGASEDANSDGTTETNGMDNDCDGLTDDPVMSDPHVDSDGDEYCSASDYCSDGSQPGDCTEYYPEIFPGAIELNDGLDNDCDCLVDEADPDYEGDDVTSSCQVDEKEMDDELNSALSANVIPATLSRNLSALMHRHVTFVRNQMVTDPILAKSGKALFTDWQKAIRGPRDASVALLVQTTERWLKQLPNGKEPEELVKLQTFLAAEKDPALTLEGFSKKLETFFGKQAKQDGAYFFGTKLW